MSEVHVEGLTRRYGDVAVVDGVDLHVRDGEFVTLLGPSGCGKTTTLRCVAGLEAPAAGRIAIGDELVTDASRGHFVPPHRRRLGMVFQSYALWPHMTVFGNVAYALKLQGLGADAIARRVGETLALVGLETMAGRGIPELSGGQQQRVALARALAARPRVLLLDEPLSNLDATLRAQMRRELRRLHRETGSTSIYVTHDQLEAVTMSDRIVVMKAGRVQQSGTPQQVFGAPASRWVAEFVGFDNFLPAGALLDGARLGGETVAIRSSSFRTDAVAGAIGLTARVLESTYVGGLTDYTLDAAGHRVSAKLHQGASPLAAGALLSLYVAPAEAVWLGAES